ncbi:MAG: C-terminal binding protein [bacterium]
MTHPKFKVVMTDYDFPSFEMERREFAKIGAEFIPAQCGTEDDVIELARDADAVINEYFGPINRRVIELLEKCKIIARTGIGVDTIDVRAATDRGICVTNVPNYCLDEVSDHVMALLLSCARKIAHLNDLVRRGIWDYKVARPMYRLRGKTLGIVGYGKTARRLVPKARGFGLDLICYDPYVDKNIPLEDGVATVDLEELLRKSDFISIHVPLNDETRGMFGEEQFKEMKKTAYIINASRGAVVKGDALYKALKEGWIAGAGLDVAEVEPIGKDSPLLELSNIVITPHSAWYSEDSMVELQTTYTQDVIRVLSGRWPRFLVNPEVKTKIKLKD